MGGEVIVKPLDGGANATALVIRGFGLHGAAHVLHLVVLTAFG
jgi:hypothetical protein